MATFNGRRMSKADEKWARDELARLNEAADAVGAKIEEVAAQIEAGRQKMGRLATVKALVMGRIQRARARAEGRG